MVWAATAVVVASTAVQYKQGKDVQEAQEEQAATEQAIAGEKSARARRKTMAAAQVAGSSQHDVRRSTERTERRSV